MFNRNLFQELPELFTAVQLSYSSYVFPTLHRLMFNVTFYVIRTIMMDNIQIKLEML